MTLPASGAITLNNVNVELGLSGTAAITMNDTVVRTLFGVSSGAIAMSDGYGKSNAYNIVALGQSGSRDVWCSYDGISFTKFTNALPASCTVITYCNGLFIAAGYTGAAAAVYYSTNGSTWSTGSADHFGYPSSIFTDGSSVVLMTYLIPYTGGYIGVSRSTDGGRNFTKVTIQGDGQHIVNVSGNFSGNGIGEYAPGSGTGTSGGNYVIVPTVPGKPSAFATNNGGSTWTNGTTTPSALGTTNVIQAIASGTTGQYVVTGYWDSNVSRVMRTTDSGANWSIVATPTVTSIGWVSATFGNGIYVLGGPMNPGSPYNNIGVYSSDGSSWTQFSFPTPSGANPGWYTKWIPSLNKFIAFGTYGTNTYAALSPSAWSGSGTWSTLNTISTSSPVFGGSYAVATR
jgi:hypothetical protein